MCSPRWYRLFAQRTNTHGLSAIRKSPTSPKILTFENSCSGFAESLQAGSHARCWHDRPQTSGSCTSCKYVASLTNPGSWRLNSHLGKLRQIAFFELVRNTALGHF